MTIEFFPKEKVIRLQDAFFYLLLLGTFGAHQFYLGNKKKAYFLLFSCGFSHLQVVLAPWSFPLIIKYFGSSAAVNITLSGYAIGGPILIWDFFTLSGQVRDKKGQADLL